MAITSSYPIAAPAITDTLVGTKFVENKEPTTNSFNIGDLAQLIANTIDTDPVTIGTANGLSLSGQVLSLGLASSSTNGALSSANWTTFNNKQNALSGTGFIKASGSTISYDNTAYTPEVRTLTINGVTYDLSANRSWAVSGTSLILTTTGTSGAATLVGDTLNIPQYTSGGGDTGSLEFNSTDLTVWNNGQGNIASNISFGDQALKLNTTGFQNAAYGTQSLGANTDGNQNTAIGYNTLVFNASGAGNTATGAQSLYSNLAGNNNTANGVYSLRNTTSGSNNSANGYFSLRYNTTGENNTGSGAQSILNNTTGNNNSGFGVQALSNVGTGSSNTAIGYQAGGNATATSTSNVYIGALSGPTSFTNESNKLYIANAGGTPLIGGDFSANTVTINGSITALQFKLSALNTAPASATATGTLGEIRYDANYMYVCVAANTWKRAALLTW